MEGLQDFIAECPYCGERIALLIDASVGDQTYVEDCQVCCQPIVVGIAAGLHDELAVTVRREDET